MRVVACCGLLICCLIAVGCNSAGKRPFSSANAGRKDPGRKNVPSTFEADAKPVSGTAASPEIGGMLAGRVVDSSGRKPPARCYVQVVELQDGKRAGTAPIDKEVDASGYFSIYGLKPNGHYQLIARAADGDHKLAGMTYATASNAKVLIKMSEAFVTPETPDVPPEPVWPGPSRQRANIPRAPHDQGADAPRAPSLSRSAVELGEPLPRVATPAPAIGPPASATIDTSNVARHDAAGQHGVAASIPGFAYENGVGNPPSINQRMGQPHALADVTATTPVPYCKVVGNRLENLALNDLEGRTWEFRKHRRRLVLLDFWGTWCMPCRKAIPELTNLQFRYGPYGLEVIGIAYEDGSIAEQVMRVNNVAGRSGINYRLLLGAGLRADCPVKSQFRVTSFPTLILVDENGQIVRRWDKLDSHYAQDLEAEIHRRLMPRSAAELAGR